MTRDGHALGTVCAIDDKPRADVGPREAGILKELAAVAADEIEMRILARRLDGEIHQRRRAESEAIRQRANQSLVRLTGGVAHEFNNLFTGLILLAENLQLGGDAALQKPLELMLNAFQRGSRLTQGMLSYSGKQLLDADAFEVAPLLQNAAAMMTALHGKAAKVAVAVAADCAPIEADSRQLLAALAELATNAVEAAAPAGANIKLTAGNAALSEDAAQTLSSDGRPGDFVRIEVADDGPGMTDEVRTQACEPFFTTKPVGGGPGLGLSMAQGFARQSGGFLAIQAAPGEGTRVAFYLPRA